MRIRFERLSHLVTVPVAAGGVEARFALDTGMGMTVVSASLCDRLACAPAHGVFHGRRMSGQEVTVPLARIDSLRLGSLEQRDWEVGVLDLSGFPEQLASLDGFLSLAFFAERPFTVDYPSGHIVLETAETVGARLRQGVAVEVELIRDGPALDAFLPLVLPGGRAISVEMDMGSDSLILDERFAREVGVDLAAPGLRRIDGTDETGGTFRRTFAALAGSVEPAGAPGVVQERPQVMFQQIIHDGLVGDSFLRRQSVTYDLPGRRVVFGPPAEGR